tara:strand:+ start:41621 stop:42679 length:1059 start_codon:yes stop_codon:yes gene_type:complete
MLEHVQRFSHPGGIYELDFPDEWIVVIEDDGLNCGFGWEDSDDVGLWISVLPFSIEAEPLLEGLLDSFREAAGDSFGQFQQDVRLAHPAFKARSQDPASPGLAWMVTNGNAVLFASAHTPIAELADFEPVFDQLMQSLRICAPEEEEPEELEDEPEVLDETPEEMEEEEAESLESVTNQILPFLRPDGYFSSAPERQSLARLEFLGDVWITYAIQRVGKRTFVREWDLEQWGISVDELHDIAMANLDEIDWPKLLKRKRNKPKRSGRLIVIENSGDPVGASKVLDLRLHDIFANHLGTPFCIATPDCESLVLFRESDLERGTEEVAEKFKKAKNPLSPQILVLSPEGVSLAE